MTQEEKTFLNRLRLIFYGMARHGLVSQTSKSLYCWSSSERTVGGSFLTRYMRLRAMSCSASLSQRTLQFAGFCNDCASRCQLSFS